MLVTIHGYYGYGNLGDDLMLYLLIERLCQHYDDIRFRVLYSPKAERDLIVTPARAAVEMCEVANWRDRFVALRGAAALVFGGGTCLHRFGFCGLYNNLAARCMGVPVVWLGVGADDVGTGKTKWKAQLALKSCHTASWRDQPSADLAGSLVSRFRDSIVAEDLAFLLPDSPTLALDATTAGEVTQPTLVVGWRDFTGYLDSPSIRKALKHGADAIAHIAARNGFRVSIIDVADLVDHEPNGELASQLRDRGVAVSHEVGLSMVEKISAIAESQACLFGRLHGVFLAKLFGKPSVAVGYAAKLDHFGELFDGPLVFPLASMVDGASGLQEMMQGELSQPAEFIEPASAHARRAAIHVDVLKKNLGAQLRRVA